MASHSVDNQQIKSSPYIRNYPKFAASATAGEGAHVTDSVAPHASTQPGAHLPTAGFASPSETLSPATLALVRQGQVLKTQIGVGRRALQTIAGGSAALGLAVACGGHPLAGFAVAAIGTLVGFGVQAYVRHRALTKVAPNGISGKQFKEAFEALLKENNGVINDPALETSRKVYDFLSRSTWGDCKHDLIQPAHRAASGAVRLGRTALNKLFSAKPPVSEPSAEADVQA